MIEKRGVLPLSFGIYFKGVILMKKILNLAVVMVMLLTASSLFATDPESAIGISNYVIDLGLRNYVNRNYGNNIALEVDLPVSQKVQFIIKTSIENDMDYTGSSWGYTPLTDVLQVWVGIPITDTIGLGFSVGGALSVSTLKSNSIWWEKSGEGQLYIQLALKLGSALFGGKLDNLVIRQMVTMSLAGTGDNFKNPGKGDDTKYVGQNIVDFINDPTTNTFTANYFGIAYQGRIITGVPLDIGLPKFDIGLELGYYVANVGYSVVKSGDPASTQVDKYDVLPNYLRGGFDFKVNFGINPVASQEFNIYSDTGYDGGKDSATSKGATNAVIYNSNAFYETIGSNWKVTFAKIVFLKLDAEWKITLKSSAQAYTGTGGVVIADAPKLTTLFNQINPGIKLGFNFDAWTLEMNWEPNFTTSTNGYFTGHNDDNTGSIPLSTAADSNVWNLANWGFSAKCSFPPPTK
jgi:hypothetical protein